MNAIPLLKDQTVGKAQDILSYSRKNSSIPLLNSYPTAKDSMCNPGEII